MTVAGPAPATDAWADYRRRVAALRQQYRQLPADQPVRLAKRTSNLFRPRSRPPTDRLDTEGFAGVLAVDEAARTADVLGMTTYEQLVDATLPLGLMPLVVPELKTITVGGALSGLGIESSSWRNGMPHESVLEIDVLTGAGEVVTARPDNEHRDLFAGFPNSYGTLGYALRVRVELEPVRPWVRLRHLRCRSHAEVAERLAQVCDAGRWEGDDVAFVDGTVFGPDESYVTVGSWCDDAPWTSDYTWRQIYYRSIPARTEDYLTVRDYIWRWDTDWFWCSRTFGAQSPLVRRLAGPRWLRSDTYWRIVALEDRWGVKSRLDRALGRPERERVIQDVEVPVGRLTEFLDHFGAAVGISPVWLCPLRQRDPAATWPLYQFAPGGLYVNLGFWSTVPLAAGADPATSNRWVEAEVDRLGGRKSLYSTAFYDEDRFWSLYNGPAYRQLKRRYDPDARLLDLYQKCVQAR